MNTCLRCGTCCSRFQVLVEPHELARIAGYLGISEPRFLADYIDTRWPVPGKYLIQHRQGRCAFLKQEGQQFLCSIHPVKPQPCLDWQCSLQRPECRSGLERNWQLGVDAEGKPTGSPQNMARLNAFLESLNP